MRTSSGIPLWPIPRSPGSRARSVHACQGLRPRRVQSTLALSHRFILPSAHKTNVGTREASISRFNGWPTCSPVNASRTASRLPAHDSGSMWIATPSLQWTFTIYSLPVSTGAPCSDPNSHRLSCLASRALSTDYAVGFADAAPILLVGTHVAVQIAICRHPDRMNLRQKLSHLAVACVISPSVIP